MDVKGRIAVVTGGASGIGKGLCEGLHRAGAAKVVVADIDVAGAEIVARSIGGAAIACDVSREDQVRDLIEQTESRHGPIDLFCSNAGVVIGFDDSFQNAAATPDAIWQKAWSINVMAHVYAARHLVPRMKARGGGYFLHTVSAAGLLTQIGGPVYATTKHAAVGFAENLAITHKKDGIKVSILCPQGVDTPLLRSLPLGPQTADGVLTPDQAVEVALQGIAAEIFLILPHPHVEKYMRSKVDNYDRWIGGMAKLQRANEKP